MPLVWVHFQANHDELPDMLYKASETYMLLIVFNVLVEVVVICFLGRDDKAFYGQQCVLTNTGQSITCYSRPGPCFVSEMMEPKSSAL